MNADSIPSSCINCRTPYFQQGDLAIFVAFYFCPTCRQLLTKGQWNFMSTLLTLVWFMDSSGRYTLPHEELLLIRIKILYETFNALKNKLPREEFVNFLSTCHFFSLLNAETLYFVELLEEYDQLIKEPLP